MVDIATSEPSEQLVLQRIRNRIIEHLEVIASFEKQRKYQEAVPYVNVPYEMINGWEDYVREAGPGRFSTPVFTESEIDAVEQFHTLWNEVADKLPDDYPCLEDVLAEPYWADFRDRTRLVLRIFKVRGKLPEDLEIGES